MKEKRQDAHRIEETVESEKLGDHSISRVGEISFGEYFCLDKRVSYNIFGFGEQSKVYIRSFRINYLNDEQVHR